jgi:hypothetical protein
MSIFVENSQILIVFQSTVVLLQSHFGSGTARIRSDFSGIRILLKCSDSTGSEARTDVNGTGSGFTWYLGKKIC